MSFETQNSQLVKRSIYVEKRIWDELVEHYKDQGGTSHPIRVFMKAHLRKLRERQEKATRGLTQETSKVKL